MDNFMKCDVYKMSSVEQQLYNFQNKTNFSVPQWLVIILF